MSKPGLQKMRKAAGWKSARAFAEHIGMPVDTYTQYEQGKRTMKKVNVDVAQSIEKTPRTSTEMRGLMLNK